MHPRSFTNQGFLQGFLLFIIVFQAKNGVAVIRPPGHHAEVDKPMGFCLLGNVPIACHFAFKLGISKYV